MKTIKTFRPFQSAPSSGFRVPHNAQRTGFTLMELLIAIGIMAVGGTMAAALFPAAIKENQSSYNNTLGTIICQNGLAIIKARAFTPPVVAAFIGGPTFGEADTVYPQPYLPKPGSVAANDPDWTDELGPIYPKSKLGFLALWRKDGDATRIIIVAYKKLETDTVYSDTVASKWLFVPVPADDDRFTVSDNEVRPRLLFSYVVAVNTGEYRKVIAIQGNDVVLDEPFTKHAASIMVFLQYDGSDPVGTRSPIINILSTRTTLRQ